MVSTIVTGLAEDMVMESGRNMCEKITIDMVVAKSWESLEFRRIIKEV